MWSFLKPEPHRPLLSKEKIDPTYKRLRWQVFIGIFIGYAFSSEEFFSCYALSGGYGIR